MTMNEYQRTLYTNLMALCHPEQDAFYYVDQEKEGHTYRIFLYRLASYSEFLKPGAMECRGHTFRLNSDGEPVALVSMPMQKFFNIGENPLVMDLDLSAIVHVMDKLDGSLISTVITPDNFILKSKGSLNSEQAQAATRLLAREDYRLLREFCATATGNGWTVNMEYMAPDNRIVVGYPEPTLKVLNVRDNYTGEYLSHYHIADMLPEKFIVQSHDIPADGHAWVENVYKITDDIEGFIVRLKDGTWFKIKTEKYCALHKTKDSITIPRRLFEACVTGGADDLRGMFASDPLAVSQINEMEERVASIYNRLHRLIGEFYRNHKHLERKEYALAGQANADIMREGVFGLVMNLYLGKEANLEEFMIKNYKKYGIKDEAEVVAVE